MDGADDPLSDILEQYGYMAETSEYQKVKRLQVKIGVTNYRIHTVRMICIDLLAVVFNCLFRFVSCHLAVLLNATGW